LKPPATGKYLTACSVTHGFREIISFPKTPYFSVVKLIIRKVDILVGPSGRDSIFEVIGLAVSARGGAVPITKLFASLKVHVAEIFEFA
jgi:hypothetical protein